VFKSILISIAIAPMLLGMIAAKGRGGGRDLAALRVGWMAYAVLWIGALYYLRFR
jgi:hypothetical protein